jgi:hypothetical protein
MAQTQHWCHIIRRWVTRITPSHRRADDPELKIENRKLKIENRKPIQGSSRRRGGREAFGARFETAGAGKRIVLE